jgi:hypothetical protein
VNENVPKADDRIMTVEVYLADATPEKKEEQNPREAS